VIDSFILNRCGQEDQESISRRHRADEKEERRCVPCEGESNYDADAPMMLVAEKTSAHLEVAIQGCGSGGCEDDAVEVVEGTDAHCGSCYHAKDGGATTSVWLMTTTMTTRSWNELMTFLSVLDAGHRRCLHRREQHYSFQPKMLQQQQQQLLLLLFAMLLLLTEVVFRDENVMR
jgi:hypothetical protein